MTNYQILALLQEAFEFASPEDAKVAGALQMESSFSEFGVSSITALEMAGYIEEKLEIQFADDELSQISNVKSFISLISKNISGGEHGCLTNQ
jgi:acyl carrier protein